MGIQPMMMKPPSPPIVTTTTTYYDRFGNAVGVVDHTNGCSTPDLIRAYANSLTGQILQQHATTATGSSSQTSMYAYAGNQALGSEDAKGNLSINGTLTGFSNSLLGTQNYVVQVGDTLDSIAQAVYGTSQYGYLIAEANGLQGDGDLTPGQTIALPQVTTSNNTATTFKPTSPRF